MNIIKIIDETFASPVHGASYAGVILHRIGFRGSRTRRYEMEIGFLTVSDLYYH